MQEIECCSGQHGVLGVHSWQYSVLHVKSLLEDSSFCLCSPWNLLIYKTQIPYPKYHTLAPQVHCWGLDDDGRSQKKALLNPQG